MCGGRGAMWRERGSNFYVSLTRRARVSSSRFSLCPARPDRPLWTGDGLGASDTVLGLAGRKEPLGRAAGNENLSGAPQIPLGDEGWRCSKEYPFRGV